MARSKGNKITGMGQGQHNFFSSSNLTGENEININVNRDTIFSELKRQHENIRRDDAEMHGIYFDKWVWDAVEVMGKEIGRGGISRLVNEVMKQYVEFHGYKEPKNK